MGCSEESEEDDADEEGGLGELAKGRVVVHDFLRYLTDPKRMASRYLTQGVCSENVRIPPSQSSVRAHVPTVKGFRVTGALACGS